MYGFKVFLDVERRIATSLVLHSKRKLLNKYSFFLELNFEVIARNTGTQMPSFRMTLKLHCNPLRMSINLLSLAAHIQVEVSQNGMGSFAELSNPIVPDGTVWK